MCSVAFCLNSRKRKVGAIKGAILPNGKVPLPAETASATENNRRILLSQDGKGENVG